jgi:LPXTG-motif cell wall-anchored protein
MKRPLALLAGSVLVSLALAAPAVAVDVPPVPVDQLTFPLEQLTGALGLGPDNSAGDADDVEASSKDEVGDARSQDARSDVGKALRDQKVEEYRAPRRLPKSGSDDSTMLLALAGLGLIATGRVVYSAGPR